MTTLKQRTVYRTANTQPTLIGIPRGQAIGLFFATAYIGQFLHSFWLWLALIVAVFAGLKMLFRKDNQILTVGVRFIRSKRVYDPHLHHPFRIQIASRNNS